MTTSRRGALAKLLRFLDRLEQVKIHYRLEHVRDSVMVSVAIPGERWEVEFFEDNHVEIERFISTGAIGDEELLGALIAEHGNWQD